MKQQNKNHSVKYLFKRGDRNPSRSKKWKNFEIINGIKWNKEVSEKGIFDSHLGVQNQHQKFQIIKDKQVMKAVNPSQHRNDANNEDQNFEDSRILNPTGGGQAPTLKYL